MKDAKWLVNPRAKMNVMDSQDRSICSCGGEFEYEDACKNANFIAAAPEMYRELVSCSEHFRNMAKFATNPDVSKSWTILADSCDKTLAKARGENQSL